MSGNTVTIDLDESVQVYRKFQSFYPKKQILEPYQYNYEVSNSENLTEICIQLLDDASCICYLYSYRPLAVELVARLIGNATSLESGYTLTIPGSKVLSAVARIVTVAKETTNLVEHYLGECNFFANLNQANDSELEQTLLAFYRLLVADRNRFSKFINPVMLEQIFNESNSNVAKYLAIQLEAIYLSLSEAVRDSLVEKHVDSNLSGQLDGETFNYQFLPVFEAQRLSNLTRLPTLKPSTTGITFSSQDLSPGVRIVSGVLVPHLRELTDEHTTESLSEFIPIDKSLNSLREMASHVRSSDPILLVGKSGSGKTFLVNELAKMMGVDTGEFVKIHLNQQTDPKLLLGTYTSGEKPGTFEWKNGVLTTAVKEGKWILIEDIDKAPNEVLSILLTLLSDKQLSIPSRGQVINAANSFQLISTMQTAGDDEHSLVPEIIGRRLWKVVQFEDLTVEDLTRILTTRFPALKRIVARFIKTYFNTREIYRSRSIVALNNGVSPRPVSIRDLMKLCKRSAKLLSDADIHSSADMIPDTIYDSIFEEAIDCFTAALASVNAAKPLIEEIGNSLEVPTSRIQLRLDVHTPRFDDFEDFISIGRAKVEKSHAVGIHRRNQTTVSSFARTNHSLRLMEKLGVGISMSEPIVLVGETGTGKTTVVQEMARLLNKKITVINVSQQTDASDLLGGFKPVSAKLLALPIEDDFEDLFKRSFSIKKNGQFLKLLAKCFNKSQWKNVVRLWKEAYKMAVGTYGNEPQGDEEGSAKKRRRLNETDRSAIMSEWEVMYQRTCNFDKQYRTMENSFLFRFVEGSLVKAVKQGNWLLLDEINLASSETLDSISDLLSDETFQRSILLSEKGDVESISAHRDFRIFGCMNPSTDVGKKELPLGIRSKFTEIYVHSPDEDVSDLLMIIDKYIGKYSLSDEWVGNDVAELYLESKRLAESHQLIDGANQKPQFSVRTLTRSLIYAQDIVPTYGLRRSLYEAFAMSFLTLLDSKSEQLLHPVIKKYTVGRLNNADRILTQIPPNPGNGHGTEDDYVQFKYYWIQRGAIDVVPQDSYIITPFVERNLLNLVRATSGRRFPILLQGPTSAGKTSMINYLAKITGHKFVRINNHEHTDLQEYLGTYVSDDTGKLAFKEGVLVEALRNGYWLVLDELNLAPTDVLEALNRLLDDNRELFIPETQEVVTPHPDFMLFATQNPPGLYGGRKILSKAFRNRFLELHFDDIPQDDLEIILRERSRIAPSYAKKIVEVYQELSVQRQTTRLFEQKNSFATLRDLFRWAQRDAVGYDQLAANGYMLLAERVRRPTERLVVQKALEKVMKVKLDMKDYYQGLEDPEVLAINGDVIWTKAMRRLVVLVNAALLHKEPILLVGETGCGKTTVCQLLSEYMGKELIIVNAHQNTETSDLLGAQRPVRNRSKLQASFTTKVREVLAFADVEISDYHSAVDAWNANKSSDQIDQAELKAVELLKSENDALFEWSDGPLVTAMKQGCHFLLDEISLADDSVLERLNSVLEPERSLLLAEKGSEDSAITSQDGFQFFATMNPGGDYGKKELSPALRNRFTEIWVPSMEDFEDVRQIVSAKMPGPENYLTDPIVEFCHWYGLKMGGGKTSNGVISLRDVLAWVQFVTTCCSKGIDDYTALLHGACMVFVDALGTHSTSYMAENEAKLQSFKLEFIAKLSELSQHDLLPIYEAPVTVSSDADHLTCGSFQISKISDSVSSSFSLSAPTTAINAMRVVRSLQVKKPVLLEGSPGVGKTSLITALADATGNSLTRINLSEQTDLIDLFGSDSPLEGGRAGEFVWRDGPFLRAMQKGEWVLLDEMNLASQSVLEGLNACLDHRGEVYIPELEKSFSCHDGFRVFAAQNPQSQGGGRKGLPKSFINRFTVVYVDTLKETDLKLIAGHLFPKIDETVRDNLIKFVSSLDNEVVVNRSWGTAGQPWEFNLRDTLRWLSLLDQPSLSNYSAPSDFYLQVVRQRFRASSDRARSDKLFESFFGPITANDQYFNITADTIQTMHAVTQRNKFIQYRTKDLLSLESNVPYLETLMFCIRLCYPCLLTGPSGAGKTELIKYCANVVGAKIYEFSMNSDIDSMDILGGFEQADVNRTMSEIARDLLPIVLETASVQMSLECQDRAVIHSALQLVTILNSTGITTSSMEEVTLLTSRLAAVNGNLSNIVERLHAAAEEAANPVVNFKWFDGMLVQAVEKGYWLILDNANLCSPSVLDRLNSLLEYNGKLVINESTDEFGTARVVTPHPDFRLFLVADPKYGELSRAMRNRAVEVYVNPLDGRATSYDRLCVGLPQLKSDNVETQLQDLQIVDDQTFKPVHAFTSCTDSTSQTLGLFLDGYQLSPSSKYLDASMSLFVGTGGCSVLVKMLESATSSELNTSFASLSQLLDYLMQSNLPDAIYSLYENALASSELVQSTNCQLAPYQSFDVSLNEYLLPILARPALDTAEAHYLLYDWSMELWSVKYLENLVAYAKTAPISSLNPLQKSAAVKFGREVKNAPKLPFYNLVNTLHEFIRSCLMAGSSKDALFTVDKYFEALFGLQILLEKITTACQQANEPYLRIYQESLAAWLECNSELYLPSHILALQACVDDFMIKTQLTRGLLMDSIWAQTRAEYPSSDVSWSTYEELISVAAQFDSVSIQQFPDTYRELNLLRQMLIDMLKPDVSDTESLDVAELVEQMRSKIRQLKEVSKNFLIKRTHLFKPQFDNILSFIESGNPKFIALDDDVLTISLLANRPTLELCKFGTTDAFKPYPRVLDSLWDSQVSMKVSLFDDKFINRLVSSVDRLRSSKGGEIDDTLKDLKLLLQKLVTKSSYILNDHLEEFKDLAKDWISQICGIFNSTLPAELQEIATSHLHSDTQAYVRFLADNGMASFAQVFDTYFAPALASVSKHLDRKSLGTCWILMSFGFLLLYVPDATYDPSTSEHVIYERFVDLQTRVGDIRRSFAGIRSVHFGDAKIHSEHYLPSVPEDMPNKPTVYRSKDSFRDLAQLSNEWTSFFESYLDHSKLVSLLSVAEEVTQQSTATIETFELNTSHFSLRLKESFSRYADLNDILTGYIYSLRLGTELLHAGSVDTRRKYGSPLWITDAVALTSTVTVDSTFTDSKSICRGVGVTDSSPENVFCNYLTLAQFQGDTTEQSDGGSFFNQALLGLYYRWSLRRLKQEEDDSKEQGVYKFTDPTMDAEADFLKMFPEADELVEASASDKKVRATPDDSYFHVARSYIDVLNNEPVSFDQVLNSSPSLLKSYQSMTESMRSGATSPGMLVSATVLFDHILDEFVDGATDSTNFYYGSNAAETRRGNAVVKKVQGAVHQLLMKWPDHATLIDLFRISTEFIDYSVSTPVARLLAKVEQIYMYIGQWEQYAHAGVSLKEEMQEISGLVVKWRQLELASWKQVLTNEEKQVEQGIGKWWFHLFETILLPAIKNELEESDYVQIVEAVNIFISQSSYGDFTHRLKMLAAFARHINLLCPTAEISSSLLNVVTFYRQFEQQINDVVTESRAKLDKDVKEVILLASWKDVNVEMLKASSQKSHRSLYKIMRKYRTTLTEPIKAIIEVGLNLSHHVDTPHWKTRAVEVATPVHGALALCAKVDTWSKRQKRLRDTSMVTSNMETYIGNIAAETFPSLEYFAKDVIAHANRLRDQTPSQLTDDNKKLCGSLKSEKRLLYSDTLKELRRMGLRLHLTNDVQAALVSVTSILATSEHLDAKLGNVDAYFFRELEMLPRLRVACRDSNTELPPNSVDKSLSAIESLLATLIAGRAPINSVAKFTTFLDNVSTDLDKVSYSTGLPVSFANGDALSTQCQYIAKWLARVVQFALDALKVASKSSGVQYDEKVFFDTLTCMNQLSLSTHSVYSATDVLQVNHVHELVKTTSTQLREWQSKNQDVAYVAEFVLDWIVKNSSSPPYVKIEQTSDLAEIERSFYSLQLSIMLSIQEMSKLHAEQTITVEDDKWLQISQRRLAKYYKLLKVTKITALLQRCVNKLAQMNYDDNSSKLASALVEQAMPMIKQYRNLVTVIEGKLVDNYINLSSACYKFSIMLLNLAKDGFCSPQSAQDQKENDMEQEGTGLGDGQGGAAADDIEDDEDFSDAAQEENKEADNEDHEDDENDVEIEGDMAGDLEDASDQDEDEDDNDDDEDEDELDDEIDNIDESDPNAVDEKMWDEKASDDSKEKESDEMPENSKANDDLQEKEDEAGENQQPDVQPEQMEDDQEAEDEQDVGEQEDQVAQEDEEKFDDQAEEADALDLPEDLELDEEDGSEDEEEKEGEEGDLGESDSEEVEGGPEMDTKEEEDANEDEGGDAEEDAMEEEVTAGDAEEEGEEEEGEEDEAQEQENGVEEAGEEAGEDSDEEMGDADETKDDQNEGEATEQVEGLDGDETGQNNEEVDEDAAAKNESGSKSEGADAGIEQEDENVGGQGGSASAPEKQEEEGAEEEKHADQSRDEASESLKQLGDSMKEFHRRRQEIKESTEETVEQKSGERPDEFQHIDNASAEDTTQALGSADRDQLQHIDEEMAIDDEEEAEQQEEPEQQDESEPPEGEAEGDEGAADDQAGGASGAQEEGEDQDMPDVTAGGVLGGTVTDAAVASELSAPIQDQAYDAMETVRSTEGERDYEEAHDLWTHADEQTRELTAGLSEQLRLILEPTLATKLRGDYKSGKRLNMKRIVPYIASDFRKDKIWMRRTKPSKREYQIMIAVDDSKSMSESHAVDFAFQSISLVSKALTQLESGELAIAKFGAESQIVHPFNRPFDTDAGIRAFQQFQFDSTKTDVAKLVGESLQVFEQARGSGDSNQWQLQIILSDGVCEDHETLQRLVRKAWEEKIMIVFVVIDCVNNQESILDMSQVSYQPDTNGQLQLKVTKYLDTFPFQYYVVVHDIKELPEMLALILRQYFTEIAQ